MVCQDGRQAARHLLECRACREEADHLHTTWKSLEGIPEPVVTGEMGEDAELDLRVIRDEEHLVG